MRQDLVIRDDQFDFPALLEAARYADRRRIRMSLLDTGRFGLEEIESLAKAGARILTSDEARPRADEWEILQEACRGAGTHLSVFWNGPLPAADAVTGVTFQSLVDLLGMGMDLHISNRTHVRDVRDARPAGRRGEKGEGLFRDLSYGPARRRARRARRRPRLGPFHRRGDRGRGRGRPGRRDRPGRRRRGLEGRWSTSSGACPSSSSKRSGPPGPRSSSRRRRATTALSSAPSKSGPPGGSSRPRAFHLSTAFMP